MCSKCGNGLSHLSTLNRHRKTVCGKVRNTSGKWKCDHCSRSYKTEGNLARHTRYECGVPRQFYCVFCNRAFTQRCSLSRHLKNFHKSNFDGLVVDHQEKFDLPSNVDSDYYSPASESTVHQEAESHQEKFDPPNSDDSAYYSSATESMISSPT